MQSLAMTSAAAGDSVLVSETNVEPMQLTGRVGGSAFLLGGSPKSGLKSGPDPYELLSAALASCTAATLRLYAERKRIPLTRIHVDVSFHRSRNGGRDWFDRVLVFEGELDQAQKEHLARIANYCPVGKTLGAGADINTSVGFRSEDRPAASSYAQAVEELEIPNIDW